MTTREQIINSLSKFLAKCKSTFAAIANIVDNCASTSTTMPLSANQGKVLQDQITELNTKMFKITPIKSATDSSANAGEVIAKEIVFTLESTPTECRFVPVVCRWCSVEKCTITISGNTVTVSMNIECLYSTMVMSINGFLIYK